MYLFLIIIFSIYLLLRLYISIMQLGFIDEKRKQEAVLMDGEAYMHAALYAKAKERLSMVEALLEYLLFIFWLGGGIAFVYDVSMSLQGLYLQSIAMVLLFSGGNALVQLPLAYYQKFVLDEKFGFNRSSVALFVKDTLISWLMAALIISGVVAGILFLMLNFALWWLYGFIFLMAIIVGINLLFPTIRALFFDKLTQLSEGELYEKVSALLAQSGFKSSGVFVSDASKRDAKLNAYFAGLGKSKRIVLFDTLKEALTTNEVLAVLGHELGHFAHKDLYKNIALIGVMMALFLSLFMLLNQPFLELLNLAYHPGVQMVLFLLLSSVLSFFFMPLFGYFSRKNEYAADANAVALTNAEDLRAALKKLVVENRSFPYSHPIYIFFYYTHPPVMKRIEQLKTDAS